MPKMLQRKTNGKLNKLLYRNIKHEWKIKILDGTQNKQFQNVFISVKWLFQILIQTNFLLIACQEKGWFWNCFIFNKNSISPSYWFSCVSVPKQIINPSSQALMTGKYLKTDDLMTGIYLTKWSKVENWQ